MQTKHHVPSTTHSHSTFGGLLRGGTMALCASIALLLAPNDASAERSYIAWAARKSSGTNTSIQGVATAVDRRGNVYATGKIFVNGVSKVYTAKYDGLTGAVAWEVVTDEAGTFEPVAITLDSQGSVLVAAFGPGVGGNNDIYVYKYSGPSGGELWMRSRNPSATNGADVPVAIGTDAQNNVYVTGFSSAGVHDDICTIKWDISGNFEWATKYVTNFNDLPKAMAVDSAGNVAVTGSTRTAAGTNRAAVTIKYNTSGAEQWSEEYDVSQGDDCGYGVAFAPNGNVFAVAAVSNIFNSQNVQVLRHNGSTGVATPFTAYTHPQFTNKFPAGIVVDAAGDVYVAGPSVRDNFNEATWTAKYIGATGVKDWESVTAAPDLDPNINEYVTDEPKAIALDTAGNVVVAGASQVFNFGFDYYAVKYEPVDGLKIAEHRIAGDLEKGQDYGTGMAVDRFGNIAITGRSRRADANFDQMITLKINRFLLSTGDPVRGFTLLPEAFVSSFNVGAIGDDGTVVTRVMVKDGKKTRVAILPQESAGGNTVSALQGETAPGIPNATYKSFADPVVAGNGSYAFIGQVAGVPASEGTAIWSNAFHANLTCLLQTGKPVPNGDPAVLVKSIQTISLRNSYLTALVTLKGTGVTAANATALLGRTNTGWVELLRGGDDVPGLMTKVKKLSVFTPPKTSPGHGRYHGETRFVALATLENKRTALLSVTNNGTIIPMLVSGDAADAVVSGATWKSFGLPAVGSGGAHYAALVTLGKSQNVTAANDSAVIFSGNESTFNDLAIEGNLAPGTMVNFAGFSDPVSNNVGQYAFIGTVKGSGVGGANKQGIWVGASAASLGLYARTGNLAPDVIGSPSQATFAGFTSLALPGGAGSSPLFLSKLKGTGVNGKNNVALFGEDSDGFLRQLLRNGDSFDGVTVKKFSLLTPGTGALNVSRTFNNAGGVIALVTLSDKTSALIYVGIP
jgi:hypothetical protein